MTVLVDSDILIEVLRGRDPKILKNWVHLAASGNAVLYSPVSEAEVWAGARVSERETIENLFKALECVVIEGEIGRLAGEYLRLYAKSHSVELGDALIAASAKVRGATLWTRNRKHYPMREVAMLV
jgi:predicted nucleic acid-binding protein